MAPVRSADSVPPLSKSMAHSTDAYLKELQNMLASGEINAEEHSVAKRRLLDAFVQRNSNAPALRSAAVELQNLQRQNLITVVEQAGCLQRLISGDHEKHAMHLDHDVADGSSHSSPPVVGRSPQRQNSLPSRAPLPLGDFSLSSTSSRVQQSPSQSVRGYPQPVSPAIGGAQPGPLGMPPLCINGPRPAHEPLAHASSQNAATEASVAENTPLLGGRQPSGAAPTALAVDAASSSSNSPHVSPGQRQGQAQPTGPAADDGSSTSGSSRAGGGRHRSGISDVMLSPQLRGVVERKKADDKIEADVMCEGTLSWPSGWFSRWSPCYAILFRSGMLYLFSLDPQTRTVQRGGERTRLWLGRATIKAAKESMSIILECFPTDGASGPSTKTLLKAATMEAWQHWLTGLMTVVEKSRAERALVYLRVASYISPEEKVNGASH